MAGFDAVANHVELLLFPVLLDLFLWLGPRWRVEPVIQQLMAQMNAVPQMELPEMADLVQSSRELWALLGQQINLFTALRSFPIGVPSLIAGMSAQTGPLGAPPTWQAPSLAVVLLVWMALTVTGLLLGTLYFSTVAQATLAKQMEWGRIVRSWPWNALQIGKLMLLWVFLMVVTAVPFTCLLSVLTAAGVALGRVALFLYVGLLVWILLPLALSAHGIFIHGSSTWESVKEGARLSRLSLSVTGLFFLMILVLSEGLNVLWRVPAETSWFLLVGVAGHAFVTTALLAATFVYYRELEQWVKRLIQQAQFSESVKS